jgi:type IV pilus assembly protein PilY1
MKKFIPFVIFLLAVIGSTQIIEPGEIIGRVQMNQYCAAPPFVGGEHAVVIPNVLICQDMTGSMRYWTEGTGSSHSSIAAYDSNRTYYGYAYPTLQYDTIRVGSNLCYKKSPTGYFKGNRVNWWHMTRMDIARKVLTGGKGVRYNNRDTLYFEYPYYAVGRSNGPNVKGVIVTDTLERSLGILREVGDKDSNYVWDADAPHFALMTFSGDSRFYEKIKCPFGDSLRKFLDTLERITPSGGTPAGDAIFEAIHYIRFCPPHFSSRNNYAWSQSWLKTPKDPWYEVIGGDTVSVSCRPTFCILIGDGGSNADAVQPSCSHLPWYDSPYGHTHFWDYDYDDDFSGPPYNGIDPYDDSQQGSMPYDHTRPGDDFAYYAHIRDLRPDNDSIYGIPGRQSITFYSVYLFARGETNDADSMLFSKIAKHGGFIDLNKDDKPGPDPAEWDNREPFGRPDNFFYADQGDTLEAALRRIFIDISVIARVTSASAATISSSGVHGEGLAYQAQFYPRMIGGLDTVTWTGAVQALWLDPYGLLREDTDQNKRLHLKNDWVVDMFFDSVTTGTKAHRYQDTIGNGIESLFVAKSDVAVESLKFIWNGAKLLWDRLPSNRTVYTMTSTSWTGERFLTTTGAIDQHLQIYKASAAKCDSMINYILGQDYTTDPLWRKRKTGGKVWKLGDVIYSSPTVVGEPMEAYHQVYGDDSYYAYWNAHQNRPSMLYVGANDGMIHAFNGGIYNKLPGPLEVAELQNGPSGQPPGTELWAYIPYNLLPHLQWLADTSYCHVYYNDLKPYATDAKIFIPDKSHTQGWGTLLICGQRFGGGTFRPPISVFPGPPPYRSSYTAFDVTASYGTLPSVLWYFNDANLGFTLCPPTMIKVQDQWFLVFGSGPQTLYGESKAAAYLYVLNPLTGTLLRKAQIADAATSITNMFGVDWGLDYSVDLLYFGTYDNAGAGKIYRINTHNQTDPARWTLHQVINLNKAITSEGSVATDDYGNLWVYFGTGKYYTSVDIANQDTNYFVGIKDDTSKGTATVPAFTLSDLLDVSHLDVFEDSVTIFGTWDSLLAAVGNKDGWLRKLDSLPGERILTTPAVLGGGVIFTSYIPRDTSGSVPTADLCITTGGTQGGNLWALYYMTGTAYRSPMVGEDVNGRRLTHTAIIGDIPSEPVMHIGAEKDKVFIQTSGGLIDYETPLPYDPRGGVILWRGR